MRKLIATILTLCVFTFPVNISALSTETVSEQTSSVSAQVTAEETVPGLSFNEFTGSVTSTADEVTNIRDVTIKNPGFSFKPYIILVVAVVVSLLIVGGISIASKKALEKHTTKKK